MLVALSRGSRLEASRAASPHDHDRCGGLWSCLYLGEAFMGSACAFPLFVLLPGGRHSAQTRRDSQPLGVQGMERCNGSVQTYIQPVHPILF